jgi:hypothetical protein
MVVAKLPKKTREAIAREKPRVTKRGKPRT